MLFPTVVIKSNILNKIHELYPKLLTHQNVIGNQYDCSSIKYKETWIQFITSEVSFKSKSKIAKIITTK